MATKTKTVRRRKGGITNTALLNWVREFVDLDTNIKSLSARKGVVRDKLLDTVEREGYKDDKGHQWFDLPEEVGGVVQLKRERRVSQALNEERTMALLEKKGLLEQCTKMVRVIDEDELTKAAWNKEITKKEFDSLRDEDIKYAFVPVKKK